jgi:hypothetical protein
MINQLGRVDVQIIMQYLDIDTVMQVATCSKQLYMDANHTFVFKHQPMIEIDGLNSNHNNNRIINKHPALHFKGSVSNMNRIPSTLLYAIQRFTILGEIIVEYRKKEIVIESSQKSNVYAAYDVSTTTMSQFQAGWICFTDVIEKSSRIKHITIHNQRLFQNTTRYMFETEFINAINTRSIISHIDIQYQLDQQTFQMFATYIKTNETVTHMKFTLGTNDIYALQNVDENAHVSGILLAEAMNQNKTIQSLCITTSDYKYIHAISDAIYQNKVLNQLSITIPVQRVEMCTALTEIIQKCTHITRLEIINSSQPVSCYAIMKAMQNNHTITSIKLNGFKFYGRDSPLLAQIIRDNMTIKTLKLRACEGIKQDVMHSIAKNNTITELNLNNTSLLDSTATHALAQSIKQNNSIKSFSYRYKSYCTRYQDPLDTVELIRAIEKSQTIQTIDLSTSYIGVYSELFQAIMELITNNVSIKHIDLNDCYLNKEKEKKIREANECNHTLRKRIAKQFSGEIGKGGSEVVRLQINMDFQ